MSSTTNFLDKTSSFLDKSSINPSGKPPTLAAARPHDTLSATKDEIANIRAEHRRFRKKAIEFKTNISGNSGYSSSTVGPGSGAGHDFRNVPTARRSQGSSTVSSRSGTPNFNLGGSFGRGPGNANSNLLNNSFSTRNNNRLTGTNTSRKAPTPTASGSGKIYNDSNRTVSDSNWTAGAVTDSGTIDNADGEDPEGWGAEDIIDDTTPIKRKNSKEQSAAAKPNSINSNNVKNNYNSSQQNQQSTAQTQQAQQQHHLFQPVKRSENSQQNRKLITLDLRYRLLTSLEKPQDWLALADGDDDSNTNQVPTNHPQLDC